jgi:hypothetical protein
VRGWLVLSAAGQKIPVQPGWYLPPQKIPLSGNRFLHAGKGAENTKEKSRQCFPSMGKKAHQMNFDLIIMAHYVNCNKINKKINKQENEKKAF